MTKEEIFSEAKICYDNCKLIISGLSVLTKELDDKFDSERPLKLFDMLLQALLFSEALADKDFCQEEKEFIESLSKDASLFDSTDIEALKDLSWEKIFNMSIEEQEKLVDSANEALNKLADEFVLPFAILDATTTQNTLYDISTQLTNISLLLSAIDGEVSEEEILSFQTYSDQLIVGKWADIKGLAEMVIDETDIPAEPSDIKTE